jgi:lipopolysaccharide/colanic/teichoic acid biosynthesis glycosyltransferase
MGKPPESPSLQRDGLFLPGPPSGLARPPNPIEGMGSLEDTAWHASTATTPRPIRLLRLPKAKRLLDFLGSACLLALFSPVFACVALLVLLLDGRPVIFRRRCIGPRGEFDAFKFRTMRRDADQVLQRDRALRDAFHQNFKLKSDPRVTKLGAVLRKFSLDELPQLFNVVRGEMSLVGPRMITAPELEKYGEYQQLLLTVRPGITGYWQVYGRQEVSYEERVRMDVEYIRNWSLGMDLKLLWLTPWRVIRGRGAY